MSTSASTRNEKARKTEVVEDYTTYDKYFKTQVGLNFMFKKEEFTKFEAWYAKNSGEFPDKIQAFLSTTIPGTGFVEPMLVKRVVTNSAKYVDVLKMLSDEYRLCLVAWATTTGKGIDKYSYLVNKTEVQASKALTMYKSAILSTKSQPLIENMRTRTEDYQWRNIISKNAAIKDLVSVSSKNLVWSGLPKWMSGQEVHLKNINEQEFDYYRRCAHNNIVIASEAAPALKAAEALARPYSICILYNQNLLPAEDIQVFKNALMNRIAYLLNGVLEDPSNPAFNQFTEEGLKSFQKKVVDMKVMSLPTRFTAGTNMGNLLKAENISVEVEEIDSNYEALLDNIREDLAERVDEADVLKHFKLYKKKANEIGEEAQKLYKAVLIKEEKLKQLKSAASTEVENSKRAEIQADIALETKEYQRIYLSFRIVLAMAGEKVIDTVEDGTNPVGITLMTVIGWFIAVNNDYPNLFREITELMNMKNAPKKNETWETLKKTKWYQGIMDELQSEEKDFSQFEPVYLHVVSHLEGKKNAESMKPIVEALKAVSAEVLI